MAKNPRTLDPLNERILALLKAEHLKPEPLAALSENANDLTHEVIENTGHGSEFTEVHHEGIFTYKMTIQFKMNAEPNASLTEAPEQDFLEWNVIVRVFNRTERVMIYSLFPEAVPPALRPRFCLLLTNINFGLLLGNFEMDLQDGELRFKTSMDVEGLELTSTAIRNLLFSNFHTMQLYFNALYKGLNEDNDLAQIIFEAEHPEDAAKLPTVMLVNHKVH